MKIKVFNTKRKYTPEGQRIAWTVIDERFDAVLVSFADVDRSIDGTVWIAGDEPANHEVLNAYDHGGYGWDQDRERVNGLYAAAREG
jgi:hypothetical protein